MYLVLQWVEYEVPVFTKHGQSKKEAPPAHGSFHVGRPAAPTGWRCGALEPEPRGGPLRPPTAQSARRRPVRFEDQDRLSVC